MINFLFEDDFERDQCEKEIDVCWALHHLRWEDRRESLLWKKVVIWSNEREFMMDYYNIFMLCSISLIIYIFLFQYSTFFYFHIQHLQILCCFLFGTDFHLILHSLPTQDFSMYYLSILLWSHSLNNIY